ncbi:MAG: hypothetical protein ABIO57_00205 [Candidatus Paceibacterota bacterium]
MAIQQQLDSVAQKQRDEMEKLLQQSKKELLPKEKDPETEGEKENS